jgi:hypothetical protein
MRTLILAVAVTVGWTAFAEGEGKNIAVADVPAAAMKAAKYAVPGFVPTGVVANPDCALVQCAVTYMIAGKTNNVLTFVTVRATSGRNTVERIDTAVVEFKTMPEVVVLKIAQMTKFRPAAFYLSRFADGTQAYFFIGARDSIPPFVFVRPNGTLLQPAKKKK